MGRFFQKICFFALLLGFFALGLARVSHHHAEGRGPQETCQLCLGSSPQHAFFGFVAPSSSFPYFFAVSSCGLSLLSETPHRLCPLPPGRAPPTFC